MNSSLARIVQRFWSDEDNKSIEIITYGVFVNHNSILFDFKSIESGNFYHGENGITKASEGSFLYEQIKDY